MTAVKERWVEKYFQGIRKEFFKRYCRNVWLLLLMGYSFFTGVFHDNLVALFTGLFFVMILLIIVLD